MEMRIEWSELSERQLKDIFDYYSIEVSSKIARKIINRIIDRVSILESQPGLGQKEELLCHYHLDFRYLVEGNYKIIYWTSESLITIAAVFDCRQNPEKIKII
ncbi:MAG: type II toxin-antitoxin system RelE/ParE family toxin [Bacteroidota bacterium]